MSTRKQIAFKVDIGDRVTVRNAGSTIIGYVEDILPDKNVVLVRAEMSCNCRWYDVGMIEKISGSELK